MAYIQLKTMLPKLTVRGQDFPVTDAGIVNVPEEFVDEVLKGQQGAERVAGDPYAAAPQPEPKAEDGEKK